MTPKLSRFATAGAVALLGALALIAVTTPPPELNVRIDGEFLRISAPRLNFLSGKALEHLHDGRSVAFAAQLTVTSEPNSVMNVARSVAHFALSYDIWEEKYSVTKIGDRPESRKASQSHMTAQQTQNWCLDNLVIERTSLPTDRLFYVQLDVRAEDPHDQLGIVGDPGISITRLIDLFSRPPARGNYHETLRNGPIKLSDLRKASHG